MNVFEDTLEEEIDPDIKIEITEESSGKVYTQSYSIIPKSNSNEKRLICFSTINNEHCIYGSNCTYAHNKTEQVIDVDRKFIYQIVLDANLMNFFSMTNPKTDEIYRNLLFLTNLCERCDGGKCTGGYNCRNGTSDRKLKLCKNDLLTGECMNKIIIIEVDKKITDKFKSFKSNEFVLHSKYEGCINGHHLSLRGLMPYYKYVQKKEQQNKAKYQSSRRVDYDNIPSIISFFEENSLSENSSDEEIAQWFNSRSDSDSDSE